MQFKPMNPRTTLTSEIRSELREAILSGQLAPGTKLVESRLAVQFGVSRAPMREAIIALVEEGLVVSEPYTGYRIQPLTEQNLRDLFGMRSVLEIYAYELIWHSKSSVFCQELKRRHENLQQAIVNQIQSESIQAELSLHSLPFEKCGNGLLLQSWESLAGKLQLYWSLHQHIHDRKGASIDGHTLLVRLASGHDFDALKRELSAHVHRGLDRVLQTFSSGETKIHL